MNIDVSLTPSEIDHIDLKDKTGVVIDVLRASSVAVVAFENGCLSILHTTSLDDARDKSKFFNNENVLLGGERNGIKPDFFDLSNSPYDYTADVISGKNIIFSSSNGSKVIEKLKSAKNIFVGSFLNVSSLCKKLVSSNSDLLISCAGDWERLALGDTVCAGMIISIIENNFSNKIKLTDTAIISKLLFENYRNNITQMLVNSDWGLHLEKLGMRRDVELCSKIDIYQMVPKLNNDVFTVA